MDYRRIFEQDETRNRSDCVDRGKWWMPSRIVLNSMSKRREREYSASDFLEPKIDSGKKLITAFSRSNFLYSRFFEYFEKFDNISSNTDVNLEESRFIIQMTILMLTNNNCESSSRVNSPLGNNQRLKIRTSKIVCSTIMCHSSTVNFVRN